MIPSQQKDGLFQNLFSIHKATNINHHINRLKKNKEKEKSYDCSIFDKFQKPINEESTQKDRNRGKLPQIDKEHA